MDNIKLLNESYARVVKEDSMITKYGFIADHIFDVTTYDSRLSDRFGRDILEVCMAITQSTTYTYIEDKDCYINYITYLNYNFFRNNISWGCSIRGAFWYFDTGKYHLDSCGMFLDGEQLLDLHFTVEEWELFIIAVDTFTKGEVK